MWYRRAGARERLVSVMGFTVARSRTVAIDILAARLRRLDPAVPLPLVLVCLATVGSGTPGPWTRGAC